MSGVHESPLLWSHEEDTYTVLGAETMGQIEAEVQRIIRPLVFRGADIQHVSAVVQEGALRAVNHEWNRRNPS